MFPSTKIALFSHKHPKCKQSLSKITLKKGPGTQILEKCKKITHAKRRFIIEWTLTDSNRRPSACKADALNQLS